MKLTLGIVIALSFAIDWTTALAQTNAIVEVQQETKPIVDDLIIDGRYTIHFDSTSVPELRPWVQKELMPACQEWYPRIVDALPSEGYEPPTEFTITFRDDQRGVAYTSGKNVFGSGDWYRGNLKGEATGSIVHELVHVVQQYDHAGGNRPPGWLIEGIADQIRWYQFEPPEKRRRIDWNRANYDDPYFPSATFLNAIVQNIDPDVIQKVNAAIRQGRYKDDYWMNQYGKTPEEIWELARTKSSQP